MHWGASRVPSVTMAKPLLIFPAHDIRTEGLAFDRALPTKWLKRALESVEAAPREEPAPRVAGRLSRSGQDIVVRGRVEVTLALPCARCLSPAETAILGDLSLLLQPKLRADARSRGAAAKESDEYEFSPGEADLDVYDGETVVLDDFVREAILLEVPTFPLCREDCPGLRAMTPEVSRAEAFDPRLAPLSAFRKKDGPVSIDDLVEAAAERGTAMGRKPVLRTHHGGKGKGKRKKGKK